MQDVLPTAAVLELFHNAFLVHDDLEDGSLMRRGAPTLHRQYGVAIAVNVGDGMHALCLQPLLDNMRLLGLGKALRILELIARMARESVEGQAIEPDWVRQGWWTAGDRDYCRMSYKKTCWYTFIAPIQIGAVVTGASDAQLSVLRRFATYMGVAFQTPQAADQTDCILATHARVVFDEMLKVVEPYPVPSSRLLHGGNGNHTEVLDLAVALPDGEVVALARSAASAAELVTVAREAGIANVAAFQGDPGSLPGVFAGEFDAALLWFAYHHRPDPERVAAELLSTLRPGGYAFLVDPAHSGMTEPDWFAALADVGAHAFHGPDELEPLFYDARFSILHWRSCCPASAWSSPWRDAGTDVTATRPPMPLAP
jgi:Polyprenyl synthetase/Methyltransferase domain